MWYCKGRIFYLEPIHGAWFMHDYVYLRLSKD